MRKPNLGSSGLQAGEHVTTFGERVTLAHDMAKARKLQSEIVRATGLTADQVHAVCTKAPERIVAPKRKDDGDE